ncbi:MAG: RNase adapter RapZ [Lachnospiraceae bacterium]|nr:RNase adapter RapZ [Lachnospiraceae bacterium]
MRLVIVTGVSGGGKSAAIKILEDNGYYCVDNLPPPLIEKFIELCIENHEVKKVAVGVDVRSGHPFGDVQKQLEALRKNGYVFDILFMDANETVLMNRYKESRRIHPHAPEGRIEDGIRKEKEMLIDMKAISNYLIDTSNLLVRDLKIKMEQIFSQNEEKSSLIVNIVSFGFKNGILIDADLVFDVRFLPNPFYVDDLKYKTGQDKEVRDFVMEHKEAKTFLKQLTDMVNFLIPAFIKEGKYQLIIGIGCTGGKHRSVTLAKKLYDNLKDNDNYLIQISHRDILEMR